MGGVILASERIEAIVRQAQSCSGVTRRARDYLAQLADQVESMTETEVQELRDLLLEKGIAITWIGNASVTAPCDPKIARGVLANIERVFGPSRYYALLEDTGYRQNLQTCADRFAAIGTESRRKMAEGLTAHLRDVFESRPDHVLACS